MNRNGWRLFWYPAFAEALRCLIDEVKDLRNGLSAEELARHPKSKLLRRIIDLIEVEIPRDPNEMTYQLGNTLGPARRHWRRAKFFSRFRLFFRFHSTQKTIVYCWMNDENTLRKAGSKTDAYTVFERLLDRSKPPDDWDALCAVAEDIPEHRLER